MYEASSKQPETKCPETIHKRKPKNSTEVFETNLKLCLFFISLILSQEISQSFP